MTTDKKTAAATDAAPTATTDAPPPTTDTPEPSGPTPGDPAPLTDTDAPPKKRVGRPPGSKTKRGRGRPTTKTNRAETVAAMYAQLGGMLSLAGIVNPRLLVVGDAMSRHSAQLGEAWSEWANTSPRVASLIDGMSKGGHGLAVLVAHLPIIQAMRAPLDEAEAAGDMFAMFAGMMSGADETST